MSVLMPPPLKPVESGQRERHWTVENFERAASAGEIAEPGRLEIIHGRMTEKMPEGGCHTGLRRRLARRLRTALEPLCFVCEECPLRIAFDGESIPDILFTRSEDDGDRHPTPADVVLLIEVADSSSERDVGEKALLYAQAGIVDYWVVLINEAVIVRHRQPSPDGYGEVTRLAGADMVSPLTAPGIAWEVGELLRREDALKET